MLILLCFLISLAVWVIYDFLCYCFMQHKKINIRTLRQWWHGEIDHDK